jgi:flagellar motor protein MotB
VAGYAEFRPLEPNDTPDRRAANRRVEIVVLGG